MYRWRWSRKRSKELRLTKTIVPSLMNFISRNWLHNWWASQPPIQTPCFYTISLFDWPPRIHMVDRMLVYVGSVPMSCKNRRSFCGNVFGFSNNPPPIITPPFFLITYHTLTKTGSMSLSNSFSPSSSLLLKSLLPPHVQSTE